MRKVKLDVWIEPDQWAALEYVAKGSDATAKDVLEGIVNTALADLAVSERTVLRIMQETGI